MGQIERSVASIITAINKINATLQRMSVYTSEHSYDLGTGSVTEVEGVAALLAGIAVETELIGNIAANCTAEGAMADFIRALAVAVSADSDITLGDLQVVTELISSLSETTTAAGVLSDATILLKAVTDSLAIIDGNINTIKPLIGSSASTTSGVAAKLWS